VNGIVVRGKWYGSVYALSTGTPTGSIAVDSNPQGAEIWIDETDMGVHTPATIDNLAEGGYRVNVTLAGYADPGNRS